MKILIFSFFILFSFLTANVAQAYNFIEDSGLGETGGQAGYEPIDDPEEALERGMARNIGIILSFVGIIFIVLIIYGGFNWMTAQGNEEQVKKAKGIVINSLIGLGIVISAYAISYFILEFLLDASSFGDTETQDSPPQPDEFWA